MGRLLAHEASDTLVIPQGDDGRNRGGVVGSADEETPTESISLARQDDDPMNAWIEMEETEDTHSNRKGHDEED